MDSSQTPLCAPHFSRLLQLDPAWVRAKMDAFLAEDMPHGDVTTLATVPATKQVQAHVLAAEALVFAGTEVLLACFTTACQVQLQAHDGQKYEPGAILATVSGPAQEILARERVMLNLLQRLCGIATQTRSYLELPLPAGFMLLDTRKTTPGLRLFEKYAVAVGGGYNQRLDLSSSILIKDNHLAAAGGVAAALQQLNEVCQQGIPVELEVDTFEQLRQGIGLGVKAFLLDNMTPAQIREAVEWVRAQPGGTDIFLEASGGITRETLAAYAQTGINGISIGALTTQARNVDIKLEFV